MNLVEKYTQSPEALREVQAERFLMEITELICELMEAQGVDQAELATRLGRSRPFVRRLLGGNTTLTVQTIADVFAALGRSVRVVDRPLAVFSPRLTVIETEEVARPSVDEALPTDQSPTDVAVSKFNLT